MADTSLTSSVAESILCYTNNDCVDSTYCCSTYSCTLPDKCLMGQKTTEDTCDYNFECYSRCCFGGICTHFLNCYVACEANSDCEQVGGCCSEGFCTQMVVCQGNKVSGDNCDTGDECLTTYCDKSTKTCQVTPGLIPKDMNNIAVLTVMTSTLIICAILLYCCRICIRTKHTHKERRLGEERVKESGRYVPKDLNANLIEDTSPEYYGAHDFDDANSLEASREQHQEMIRVATGRRMLFNQERPLNKAPVAERYQRQVVPISENSDEQMNLTVNSNSEF